MKNSARHLLALCLGLFLINLHLYSQSDSAQYQVEMKTSMGDITLLLYNETPQHRDNFIKLVKEGFYEDVIFHRVINEFMIQGGDPNSKNADAGEALGNGGPGYTIPAEFNNKLHHKRGALAAARMGDNVNPNKESSGSQFYIVTGKKYTEEQLANFQKPREQQIKNKIFNDILSDPANAKIKKMVDGYVKVGNKAELQFIMSSLEPKVNEIYEQSGAGYSAEQINDYLTIGGTPHLDANYTVFGEVIEGMDVVDQIQKVKTDGGNRPVEDVVIKKIKLKKVK